MQLAAIYCFTQIQRKLNAIYKNTFQKWADQKNYFKSYNIIAITIMIVTANLSILLFGSRLHVLRAPSLAHPTI